MHQIMYRSYSGETFESKINDEVRNYVSTHGDRYGTTHVQFLKGKICKSADEAEEYISQNDKLGDYKGLAVQYYDFSEVEDSKKITDLRNKISETIKKREEFINTHSVKLRKADFIKCPSCYSKLNRERLRSEKCPLCFIDLRSATTLERIDSFQKRIGDYRDKIAEEQAKDTKKAKVKWLVKFEYHC